MNIMKVMYEGSEGREDRGEIREGDRLVSCTYPVPYDMSKKSEEEREHLESAIICGDYRVEELYDGTLLRLSYLGGKWLLSTNGKIDAREAYWMNGCSFYEQFWSAVKEGDIDESQLNKNYVYLFILCHPLNVIVVNHKEAKLYHVATYDMSTVPRRELPPGVYPGINVERPVIYNMTISDVHQKIEESKQKPVDSAGYMVISQTESGKVNRYRYENYNYIQARDLRGDSNNIQYHILSLMYGGGAEHPQSPPEAKSSQKEGAESPQTEKGFKGDQSSPQLEEFLEYYPMYHSDVVILTKRISSLVSKLYREYGQRFKEHVNIRVHPRHHRFLNEIHTELYLGKLRGQSKTVQYQDIMDYVKSQPTARLLYLLNYIYDVDTDFSRKGPASF